LKRVEVIIKKSKYKDVKEALHGIGIVFFSYWDVSGYGKQQQNLFYKKMGFKSSVKSSDLQKRFLSIVIPSEKLELTVKVLLKSAYTGKVGDGKIFISTIEESLKIRTIEDGIHSIQ
jgi:nitrogen regulatory protein P-II 1